MSTRTLWSGQWVEAELPAPAPPPVSSPPRAPASLAGAPASRRRPARPRPWAVDVLAGVAGLGLGVTLALAVSAESSGSLSAPGGIATALGRVAGLVAAYAMVVVVVLEQAAARRLPGRDGRPGPAGPELTAAVRSVAGVEVAAVLVVDRLPLDIRHSSKVDRVEVARRASRVLAGG